MGVEKRLEEINAEFDQVTGKKQQLDTEVNRLETRLIELRGAHQEVSRDLPKKGEKLPKVAPKNPPVEEGETDAK